MFSPRSHPSSGSSIHRVRSRRSLRSASIWSATWTQNGSTRLSSLLFSREWSNIMVHSPFEQRSRRRASRLPTLSDQTDNDKTTCAFFRGRASLAHGRRDGHDAAREIDADDSSTCRGCADPCPRLPRHGGTRRSGRLAHLPLQSPGEVSGGTDDARRGSL